MADGTIDLTKIDPSRIQFLPDGAVDLSSVPPSAVQVEDPGPAASTAPGAGSGPIDLTAIDPAKVEDSWSVIGRKLLENAPSMFKQVIGGMGQALSETPVPAGTGLGLNPNDPMLQEGNEQRQAQVEAMRAKGAVPGQQMFDEATKDLLENAPNVDPESAKGYAYDIGQGLIQMGPAVAASLLTKSAAPGAMVIGSQVYGTKYGESRAAGRTAAQAAADATFYGAAEAIPEMIPLGVLMKPGGRFLARTLKTAGAESIQEMFTQALQDGYDAGVIGEDMTWGQAVDNMIRAGIVGGAVGGGMGAAVHPFVGGETAETTEFPAEPKPAPSTGEAAQPPTPDIKLDEPVGLKTKAGVIRVVPVSLTADHVIFAGEDGAVRGATFDEFRRDLAPLPKPTLGPNNATTLPSPPEFARSTDEPPPPGVDDLNDFNPWAEPAEPPRAPAPPPPQQAMPLPDPTVADALTKRVEAIEAEIARAEAGINPKTPEQLKVMRQVAAEIQNEAAGMLTRIRPTGRGPEGSIAEPTPLGRLSAATRGLETEATTGINLTEPGPAAKRSVREELQAREPLLQAKPAVSEAARPLPPPDTDAGRLLPMSRAVGAETEATTQMPEAAPRSPAKARPSFDTLLAERRAVLNNPQKLARQLGVTPEEASAIVQKAAAKGQVRQIKGAVKTDKAGTVTQSKMAGRYAYLPDYRGPQSLFDFLAAKGGIREESGELAAMDLQRRFIPGRGKLVRPNGLSHDTAREAAAEAGFTLPDGRPIETVADLRAALDVEARGQKLYPVGDAPETAAREYDPEQMRQIQAENSLRQLGEETAGGTLEDVEAQLEERLALMGAATVDEAIRIYESESERIMGALSEQERAAVLETGHAEDWAATEADRRADASEGSEAAPRAPPGEPEPEPVAEGAPEPDAGGGASAAAERGAPGETFTTERTDQGQQAVIPGAERSAVQAQKAQPERLRADVPQKPADEGLFGDEHKQASLGEFWSSDLGAADPLWFLNLGKAIKASRAGGDTAIGREAARLSRDTKPDTAASLNPANAFMTMPAALASRDAPSAHYFNALLDQHRTAETMESEAIPQVTPYLALDEKAQTRVNKVMEYARLYGHDLVDDGRNVVVMVPKTRTAEGAAFPELSRPGEVIALDAKETAAFHSLRDFFTERLRQMGEAIAREAGYEGAFDEMALKSAATDPTASAGARKAADRALTIWNETVGAGRRGYVPFARYGNKYIKITPKVGTEAGKDAAPSRLEDGWFEFVEESRLGNKVGRSALRDRIAELRKRFPADKFDLTAGDVADIRQQTDTLNIPALERIISRMGKGADAGAAVDAVMRHVFELRKAGFRKQAQNIPGYSTDFPRAIVDYVRHSSAMIARLEHRKKVDAAYDATQSHRAAGIAEYWKNHKAYMESNGGDFGSLRKIAFFQYLWGSPASAAVNLTQTGLVTAPQLAAWAGPRAAPLLGQAMGEAAAAVRVGAHGLEMDWSKIGRTPAERAMIQRMVKDGTLNPVLAREFEGTHQMASKRLRPYSKRLGQIWEIGASGFNVAEQINRATAALAYFRAANNPALLKKMTEMHRGDTRFRDLGPMTPEKAAQWGVDETQFIGGKINRAPMQRGVGGLALQMRTYQLNTLRLLYKNKTRMGPQGKIAASLMMAALVAVSGLYGLPFADDADKLATAASKWWTGIDPMGEMRLREFVNDAAMDVFGADEVAAKWLAEAVARGSLRETGIDIGSRIGMGNVVPDGTLWSAVPLLSATIGRAQQFWQAVKSGQPMGAAAQIAGAVAGKPGQDIVQAAALPIEGKRTRAGDIVVPPSEITPGQVAARATGFNPAAFARKTERRYQEGRLAAATRDAASALLRTAAAHLALAEDARKTGDTEKEQAELAAFDRILRENAERLDDPDIPEWQQLPMPTRQAIRAAVGRQLDYDQSVAKRSGKMKRDQITDLQQIFGD